MSTSSDPHGEDALGVAVALTAACRSGDAKAMELLLDSADDLRSVVLTMVGVLADFGEPAVGQQAFESMLSSWQPGRQLSFPDETAAKRLPDVGSL